MTPKYKQLQEAWYSKLKESGFKDIEYADGSLKSYVPTSFTARDPLMQSVTEEYYRMCYHFLNEYKFESELEKVIWEYHSNGLSARNIYKILTAEGMPKWKSQWKKSSIHKRIKNLVNLMKQRYLLV